MNAATTTDERDPVCGMTVSATSPHHHVHDGHDYHFCSNGCREKFAADPAKYLGSSEAPVPSMVLDPVCGMKVSPESLHHHVHQGHDYRFCSAGCQQKFAADPAKYLTPAKPVQTAGKDTREYTCPMHPQVRQIGPGSCPICGMALEPVVASASDEPPKSSPT